MAMSTNSSGGRGRKKTMNEINVTPLVDVMLVLLIIFMVAAPMMHQGIEVNLPETKSSGVEATSEEPFLLVIRKDQKIFAGTAEMNMNEIESKLKAIFETRQNKQIYIQADRDVDYGTVAQVMAEVRGAGLTNIGLITLPKAR